MVGHFTALIWSSVSRIGCAFSRDGKMSICRYAPAGNELSADTPNMNGESNYRTHVFPRTKDEGECEDAAPSDTGNDAHGPSSGNSPGSDPSGGSSQDSSSAGSSGSYHPDSSSPGSGSGKSPSQKSTPASDACKDYPSAECNKTFGVDVPASEYPDCPGDGLKACMAACPSKPLTAFGVCSNECAQRCNVASQRDVSSVDQTRGMTPAKIRSRGLLSRSTYLAQLLLSIR